MKTFKTLIIIFTLAFLANNIYAQGFGVRAGINFQNVNGKDFEGDNLENKLTTGFHAGINYEVPVGTDIYFQPGLLFSTKGSKLEMSDIMSSKLSLSYIELPLNLVFKPLLGTGHMLLGLGPYLGYGIGGKATERDFDVEFQNEVVESDPDDVIYLKAFDAGANFIIGYEFANMVSFQLNAQLGLLDIFPDYWVDDDTVWKNTGFGLSVGYRF